MLIHFVFLLGTSIFIWILIYGTTHGYSRYLYGITELASDNSAAAAYYPDNNWWQLSILIFLFLFIPFVHKNRFATIFYALLFFLLLLHGNTEWQGKIYFILVACSFSFDELRLRLILKSFIPSHCRSHLFRNDLSSIVVEMILVDKHRICQWKCHIIKDGDIVSRLETLDDFIV